MAAWRGRHGVAAAAAFALWLAAVVPRCTCSAAEANSSEGGDGYAHGDVSPHPLLRERELQEVIRLLGDQHLAAVLGPWARDSAFLRSLNSKLVRGPFALIDGFFKDSAAEALVAEAQALAARGKLVEQGPIFNTSGGHTRDLEYASSSSAGSRCAALKPQRARPPRGRFASLHRKAGSSFREESPLFAEVSEALGHRSWADALNLLLTGSGMTLPPSGIDALLPTLRQFAPGDFEELRSDADVGSTALGGQSQADRRTAVVQVWLSDRGDPRGGGGLLWCGRAEHGHFPEAERVEPLHNRAVLHAPHAGAVRGTELVEAGAAPLFVLASALRATATYFDVAGHQEALRLRQAAAAKAEAMAAFAPLGAEL